MANQSSTSVGFGSVLLVLCSLVLLCLGESPPQLTEADSRVAYGTPVRSSRYPSYVAVTDGAGGFICGGTLLSSTVVLTAQHCLNGVSRVTAGTFKMSRNGYVRGGTTAKIKRKVPHSGYNPSSYIDDIALLILDRRITGYKVAKLATKTPSPGRKVTVVGYGETAGGHGTLPTSLQEASMMVRRGSTCRGTDSGEICLEATRMSNGGYNEICSGDSGGPAYSSSGVVAGVASYGEDRPCGRNPWSVYTDVAYFSKWIKANMAKYGGGTSGVGGSGGGGGDSLAPVLGGSPKPKPPSKPTPPSTKPPPSSPDDYDYDYKNSAPTGPAGVGGGSPGPQQVADYEVHGDYVSPAPDLPDYEFL